MEVHPAACAMLSAMSNPSEKAIEAGASFDLGCVGTQVSASILRAAHDPALGLDRSVCLRDVVEALKARHPERMEHPAADFIEREFGS